MSAYAYDKNGNKILATNVNATNQYDDFFCPNTDCKCLFHFRAYESNVKTAHFFRLPSSKHIDDCWADYEISESGNIYHYASEEFSPANFLQIIQTSRVNSDSPSKHQTRTVNSKSNQSSENAVLPIRTLRQLYSVCLYNDDTQQIGDRQIKDIFVGRKTSYLYTKYCSGLKLVEVRYNGYDPKTNMLFFTYPYRKNNENPSIKFIIHLPDNKLFKKKNTELYELYYDKKRIIPVLIYAEFEMHGIRCCATISCSKQIIPLKTAD